MRANSTTAFSDSEFIGTKVFPMPGRKQRVVVQEFDADWRDAVVERLNELVALPIGWDGYLGKPVSFHNAHFALSMLNSICPEDALPPQIVPGTGGDLQIEWHTHHEDIELHLYAPFRVTAWRATQGGDQDDEEVALERDFTTVAEWIEEMMEKYLVPNAAAA